MVPLFCPGCIEIKREIKNREPANLWTSRDELPRLSQDLLQLSQVLWQMFPRNGTLFQICSIILYMHESEINFSSLLQLSQVLWQMFTRNGTLFQIRSIVLYMHESEINFSSLLRLSQVLWQMDWDFISDSFNCTVHARI
jgi:hypothetical protein